MNLTDIFYLSLRNLREAKLRAALTTMGVIVGVAVIVTMVSFGLGLQRNTVARFKALDLFNEIRVFGRGLASLATGESELKQGVNGSSAPKKPAARGSNSDKTPTRVLDDAAVSEIAKIPGVAYVEPSIFFQAYLRANGHVLSQTISGVAASNTSSRFQEFSAGGMIKSVSDPEMVVSERLVEDFGYGRPLDAVGTTVEFLASRKLERGHAEEVSTFFGLPLEGEDTHDSDLVAHSFHIVGVTKADPNSGGGNFRGLMPNASAYIPLGTAEGFSREYRNPMNEVALQLARQRGALSEGETEGYDSAVIRVTNPIVLTEVRKRLTDLGFGSFSILDQLEQLRTVFLIMDSALGLLGGISLLVASFGIANTMIMSILERTREIGIMKAIGAEDREIRLIFFVEALVIGFTGGIVGSLVAWGIDVLANRLAFRFILKPQGGSYIDFFSLPPLLWGGSILFAAIISILAALYPASRAARIDPVEALRHT